MARRSRNARRRYAARHKPGNQSGSRLMMLPAEIRNRIYELVLSDNVAVIDNPKITAHGHTQCLTDDECKWSAQHHILYDHLRAKSFTPHLLLTCKKAYDEAINMHYALTIFWVGFNPLATKRALSSTREVRDWFKRIGRHRAANITTIYLAHSITSKHIDPWMEPPLVTTQDLEAIGQEAMNVFGEGVLQSGAVKAALKFDWCYDVDWASSLEPEKARELCRAAQDEGGYWGLSRIGEDLTPSYTQWKASIDDDCIFSHSDSIYASSGYWSAW